MENLLQANMEAGFPVDPLTLSLRNGWDFDIACPPNLVELQCYVAWGDYKVLPDSSQPGYCYVFKGNWDHVYGGEWDTKQEAIRQCLDWVISQ